MTQTNMPLEIRSEELRLGTLELEKMIGHVGVDDYLDVVFRQFCVGK